MISIERISAEELNRYLKLGRLLHYEEAEELDYLIDLYLMTGETPDFEEPAPKIEENPLTK